MLNIEENKARYLELIESITRPGFRKEEFINMIKTSDFCTTAASTKYHNDMDGGLCDHSLKVYDNLCKLVELKNLDIKDQDTLKIVALMHDLGKINQYVKGPKNIKRYCKSDEDFNANKKAYNKQDDLGVYGWFTELRYEISDNKFIYGNHEMSCEYIASTYIPLTIEESVAILHHMGGMSGDSAKSDLYTIYRTYPLALLLFEADLMAAVIDEEII